MTEEKSELVQIDEKCSDYKKNKECDYWSHLRCGDRPCEFHYQTLKPHFAHVEGISYTTTEGRK